MTRFRIWRDHDAQPMWDGYRRLFWRVEDREPQRASSFLEVTKFKTLADAMDAAGVVARAGTRSLTVREKIDIGILRPEVLERPLLMAMYERPDEPVKKRRKR